MRHRIQHRKLNRTSEHRKALLRNMAQSIIEHGSVKTTLPKAKTLRPFVEKLISLAVKSRKASSSNDRAGALRARRGIHKLLGDRSLIPKDHFEAYEGMTNAQRRRTLRMASGRRHRTGEPKGRLAFTGESITHRLIENVAARFEDRPGGYTRIVRTAQRRVGDASFLAYLQLVGDEEAPTSLTRPARSARQRRAKSRYDMAAKLAKGWSAKGRAAVESAAPTEDAAAEEASESDGE